MERLTTILVTAALLNIAASTGFAKDAQTFDLPSALYGDYSEALGHGWQPASIETSRSFPMLVPEGNHRVTVTLGNAVDSGNSNLPQQAKVAPRQPIR